MNKFFVFIFSFSLYFFSWYLINSANINSLKIQSEDTIPALFLPFAIINERSLYLDTYYQTMIERYPQPDDKDQSKGLVPFYLKKVDDHYLSAFTIITPILILPIYWLGIVFGLTANWHDVIFLSHLSSAYIMALCVTAFYALLYKNFSKLSKQNTLLLTFIYGFCTINYALISQALWQHGTLQLFLILGLNFLISFKWSVVKSYRYLYASGLFLSLAILSRPTALLFIPFLYVWLVFDVKSIVDFAKRSLSLLLGTFLPILFFLLYNALFYKSFSNQGYSGQLFDSWQSQFPEGFLGIWLSPSKGILIFSPILIFIFFSLYKIVIRKPIEQKKFFIMSWLIVLTHCLVMGKWKHWYGGWSFGYRMAADIIPFLVLLLIPFMQSTAFKKFKHVFYLFLGISFLIQVYGIIFFDGIWHAAYDQGFRETSWLWSLNDSEWAFNIRRVLVKLGYLDKACPKCI